MPTPFQTLSFRVLLLTVFSYGVVNNIVFSLMPLMGTELGLRATAITLIGTCAALVVFLVSPFWGRTSQRWGRRNCILLGMVGYGCASALLALVFTLGSQKIIEGQVLYLALLGTRVLQAFLLGAMLPATTAFIIDATPVNLRTQGMSRSGAAHGLGAITGPSLLALGSFGLLWPLYIGVAIAWLVACLVMFSLKEPPRVLPRASSHAPRLGYFDPRYRAVLLVGFLMYVGLAVIVQTLGFYLPHVLGIKDATQAAGPLGLTQVVMACSMLFAQMVLVQRLQWSPLRLLAMGLPLVMVAFVLLAVAPNLLILRLAMAFAGLGLGMAGPGFAAEVSLRVQAHEQGAVSGIMAACPALGFVIGPICSGVIYDISPMLTYVVAALLLLFASGLALRLFRSRALPDLPV